jgi:hypothetical protein
MFLPKRTYQIYIQIFRGIYVFGREQRQYYCAAARMQQCSKEKQFLTSS